MINSLSETKDFDKIKIHTSTKTPTEQNCSYCGSNYPPRQYLAYDKKCRECGKINHFREVCRSVRGRVIHNVEQEPEQRLGRRRSD